MKFFLEDVLPLLEQAREAVGHGVAREAAIPLQAIALDAAVLDMPDLRDLADGLVRLAENSLRDDATLAAGLHALAEAVDELVNADESGARYDPTRVRRAADALHTLPPPPPAPSSPPVDEQSWEPTVDEDMIDPFLEECHDRLESLSERLIQLERAPDDEELIRAVFRDLHTLKGSSGFVGLTKMARLAHVAEDLVGQLRDGSRATDRAVVDALLATLDVLQAIVQRAADRAPIDVDVRGVMARLKSPGATMSSAPPRPSAPPPPSTPSDTGSRVQQTLRVDFAKLDELMNLVGELVLSKGRVHSGLDDLAGLAREIEVQRRGARRGDGGSRRGPVRLQDFATELGRVQRAFDSLHQDMQHAHRQLDFVSGQLRDQVMKLRMVPVGRSWTKYHRTVRQIAGQLGKEVHLELAGEDTELDKVLVEQLDDPLLHLVRNAIDHGIESPSERMAAGKPEFGTLTLSAYHRGNQIVVSIADDGKGIDVSKVRDKAVERGLISQDAAQGLEPAQVYDLLFHAGFSTAERVSDLSGRGVGMDVVRDTIARLKGTVHVESRVGEGSRFELRLPLTLAIIQVLLLRAGGQTFAVPLDLVRRTLSVSPSEFRRVGHQDTLLIRDHELPLLHLRPMLGLGAGTGNVSNEASVVLVEVGSQQVGLVCEQFLGRREVVLKSMGTLIRRVPGAAGATLLGDRPALILDVPALVAMAMRNPQRVSRASVVPEPSTESVAERARILVVEDADVIRETIRRTLERAGYEVVVARDGAEGLSRAREGVFDLVSTDVVMPTMDGYELTRRLRAMEAYRDVPILMVTSKDERIDRIRGFDAGVDAYLSKPTDAAELLRVVQRHLR